MKKIFTASFLFALLIILSIPKESHAYLSTHQAAVQLDAETVLFTVTYKFSWLSYGLAMPIGATRGISFESASPFVGYELLTHDGKKVTDGDAYAVVLSPAKISGGSYGVPTSTAEEFTLIALVNLPDTTQGEKVHLQVTKLPFTLIKNGVEEKVQLSTDQLKTYTTPEIEMK